MGTRGSDVFHGCLVYVALAVGCMVYRNPVILLSIICVVTVIVVLAIWIDRKRVKNLEIKTKIKRSQDLIQKRISLAIEGYREISSETKLPGLPNSIFDGIGYYAMSNINDRILMIISGHICRECAKLPTPHSADDISPDETSFWKYEAFNRLVSGGYPSDWSERRRLVIARDGHRCVRCGCVVNLDNSDTHHIHAVGLGGNHAFTNLITLCDYCHIVQPGHAYAIIQATVYIGRDRYHQACCSMRGSRVKILASRKELRLRGSEPCKKCDPDALFIVPEPKILHDVIAYVSSFLNEVVDGDRRVPPAVPAATAAATPAAPASDRSGP